MATRVDAEAEGCLAGCLALGLVFGFVGLIMFGSWVFLTLMIYVGWNVVLPAFGHATTPISIWVAMLAALLVTTIIGLVRKVFRPAAVSSASE